MLNIERWIKIRYDKKYAPPVKICTTRNFWRQKKKEHNRSWISQRQWPGIVTYNIIPFLPYFVKSLMSNVYRIYTYYCTKIGDGQAKIWLIDTFINGAEAKRTTFCVHVLYVRGQIQFVILLIGCYSTNPGNYSKQWLGSLHFASPRFSVKSEMGIYYPLQTGHLIHIPSSLSIIN